MDILICYRSHDDSNGLVSSAVEHLKRANRSEHITIWNLDKYAMCPALTSDNKLGKILKPKVDALFLFETELDPKRQMIEHLLSHKIQCEHSNVYLYNKYKCHNIATGNDYKCHSLAEGIIALLRKSSGTVRRFVARGGTIYQEDVYVCDLQPYHYTNFQTAQQVAIKWLQDKIVSKKADIEYDQQRLREFENQLELLKNSSE